MWSHTPRSAADIGDLRQRIDGAGERGAGGGNHRHRCDAVGTIGIDRRRQRLRGASGGGRRSRSPARRCVPSPTARPRARSSSGPRPSSRPAARRPPSPSRRTPGSARSRAAASAVRFEIVPPLVNAPAAGGIADQLADPSHRLLLDLRGRSGVHRQIGIEARCQRVADHADLEPRRADEREVPRARLGDALVQDPGGILQQRWWPAWRRPAAMPKAACAPCHRPPAAPAGRGRTRATHRRSAPRRGRAPARAGHPGAGTADRSHHQPPVAGGYDLGAGEPHDIGNRSTGARHADTADGGSHGAAKAQAAAPPAR